MFIPSSIVSKDQEIVCTYTGESYAYLEKDEINNLTSEQKLHCLEVLPERFHKHPRVMRGPNGDIRVYGIKT